MLIFSSLSGTYGSPNWPNIGTGSENGGDNSGSAHTAGVTRTLTMTASMVNLTGANTLTVTPNVNGSDGTPLNITANGVNQSFSHPVRQACYFKAQAGGAASSVTCRITVTWDGGSDTFDVALS